MEPEQAALPPPPVVQRQNPKWMGLIMAWFLPGSAHFLSGQRRTGAMLLFTWLLLSCLPLFPLSVPGVEFFYVTVGLFATLILFLVALLISSWRPTRRFVFTRLSIVVSIECIRHRIFLCNGGISRGLYSTFCWRAHILVATHTAAWLFRLASFSLCRRFAQ